MSNNEESSSKEEVTSSKETRTSSITECLSVGPLAAASRLMSSLTRQNRNDNPTGSNEKTVKSPTSSSPSTLKPGTGRKHSARNRSSSPISPSSEPSKPRDSNPFLTNSSPSSSSMRTSSTTPSGLNRFSKSSTTSGTQPIPTPETVDLNFNFDVVYKELGELAEINRDYFSQQKTDVCRRFARLLVQLRHSLELSVPLIRYLTENFHHFDYSTEVIN